MTELDFKEKVRKHRESLANKTTHDLARDLLQLPDVPMTFAQAVKDSEGTIDMKMDSSPWYVDWKNEVRVMIAQSHNYEERTRGLNRS